MTIRDLSLALLICLIWAVNQVMSRLVVANLGVPPIFYALMRSLIIAAVLLLLLRPRPQNLPAVILVGVLLGGGGFALNFMGLQFANPSAAAVVLQLSVPMATLLSIFVLGERVGAMRLAGILLAFCGILVLLWDPGAMAMSYGLLFSAGSALCGACGAILLKKVGPLHPLRLQAWGGLASIPLLLALTGLVEDHPLAAALNAGWPFVLAACVSALVVSVFSHSLYYRLLQTYEASQVVPFMLLHSVMTVALGVVVTGDHFTPRMAAGGVVTLFGVFLIIRSGRRAQAIAHPRQ